MKKTLTINVDSFSSNNEHNIMAMRDLSTPVQSRDNSYSAISELADEESNQKFVYSISHCSKLDSLINVNSPPVSPSKSPSSEYSFPPSNSKKLVSKWNALEGMDFESSHVGEINYSNLLNELPKGGTRIFKKFLNNSNSELIRNETWKNSDTDFPIVISFLEYINKHLERKNAVIIRSPLGIQLRSSSVVEIPGFHYLISLLSDKYRISYLISAMIPEFSTHTFKRVFTSLNQNEEKEQDRALRGKIPVTYHPAYMRHPEELIMRLYEFEAKFIPEVFKFGILFAKNGQETDQYSMLANEVSDVSSDFWDFCDVIADKIPLANWKKYSGGLKTKEESTEFSYYTILKGQYDQEIMFHVGPLLYSNPNDKQQVDRKKHIGNDSTCIVFLDDASFKFIPWKITSKQIHVFVIVRIATQNEVTEFCNIDNLDTSETFYRVQFAVREGLSENFNLRVPKVIRKGKDMREILLRSMILAELATYDAPGFAKRVERTRISELNRLLSIFS